MVLPAVYSDFYKPTEALVLFPSAARGGGAAVLGTVVPNPGRLVYTWVLTLTNAATDATDTCDVYIDTLIGPLTGQWVNIVHFTQILGNGADAIVRYCVTVPANMLTTDLATGDRAAGVSIGVVGSQFRGRYTIVDDAGGGACTFTFSLNGYAQ